jgi:diphthine-ammonia ligase
MRLGVLFSGGKDSCLAHHIAVEEGETVACLVTLLSENPESYLFHTPNVHLTSLQAEAMGLPIVARATRGEKEAELDDLRAALEEARDVHGIEGAVSGAVASVYQATRFQRATTWACGASTRCGSATSSRCCASCSTVGSR